MIYLNHDWAMKFLPVKSREPQSEFFGKRGISWHIIVVMKNDANGDDYINAFDTNSDISDNTQEDNEYDMSDLTQKSVSNQRATDDNEDKRFSYKVFVHVFDECSQDSETIVTVLNDILRRVKETDPQIKTAFIRSDNAGCYHSVTTLVTVKRIDFCDPQGSKGPCNRYAACY